MAVNDALTRLAEQSEPASAGQLASFSNVATAVEHLRASKDLSDADRKAVDQLADAFTTMHEPQPADDVQPDEAADAAIEQPASADTAPPADGGRTRR